MKSIYLSSGYLDQGAILEEAKRSKCNFIIEIGARQVGKTYGTLQLMLRTGSKFILMRRTQTEADFLTNGTINPFLPVDPDIVIKKETAYTGAIKKDDKVIGMTAALSTISKIRGFYGGDFSHLVYDEFIPERHITKMRYEAEAFLNALVTISGNREIEGKEPLYVWLLANSNNLASPILQALHVQDKIESMIQKKQELSIMTDRGIIIVLPHSEAIRERRQRDSITRAIGSTSDFSRMAYGNEFAYNDAENVKRRPLSDYKPLASVAGVLSVYQSKGDAGLYVTDDRASGVIFPDTERGRAEFVRRYTILRAYYIAGKIGYESLTVKEKFKELFKF